MNRHPIVSARTEKTMQASHLFRAQACSAVLYADGSPQWRGTEFWAASLEVARTENGIFSVERILLPPLRLGGHLLNRWGKTYALLWQLYLCAGRDANLMQLACDAVQGITSDMGVERLIPEMEDCLPTFLRHVGLDVPEDFPIRAQLFPNSILAPGWAHLWDTVLKKSALNLPWFPSWLLLAKAIGTFMRSYVRDVSRDLKAADRLAPAEILTDAKQPHFAKWRWFTLLRACRGVLSVYFVLRANWPFITCAAKIRDTALVSKIREALEDPLFEPRLRFVAWLTEWITGVQSWGQSCICHQDSSEPKPRAHVAPYMCVFVFRELFFQHRVKNCSSTIPKLSIQGVGLGPSCRANFPVDLIVVGCSQAQAGSTSEG